MKTVIITVHGQESNGKTLKQLSDRLAEDIQKYVRLAADLSLKRTEVEFINIRYPRLLTVVNALPWVRKITAKYIAARLDTIDSDNPEANIIVIAHSNATRAMRIAMDMRYNTKKNWPKFKVDGLILLGCVIKRNYDWSNNPYTEVINLVSTNDKIVWLARFYGMGSAGRFGFKKQPENLMQLYNKYGHSGFMQIYYTIKTCVKYLMK